MGISNRYEIPEQRKALDDAIKTGLLEGVEVKRIALLGVQREGHSLVRHYKSRFPNAEIKFFDSQTHKQAENWDLNGIWNLEGYDIIACHRTTPYIDDMKNFLKEMKKCIKKNKLVIFDFLIYPSMIKSLDSYMQGTKQYRAYEHGNPPPGDESCIDFRDDLPADFKYSESEAANNCFLTAKMACKYKSKAIKSSDFFKSVGTPVTTSFRISPLKGIPIMISYWLNVNS